jgi:pimeloyl-ACP methyl ester carboxylesterase
MIPELPAELRELFPFEPHWVDVAGFTLHYVDEGPRSPDAVVLLHGNPTWSFIYRDFIPRIRDAGFRVVAPDFLGSGRSDQATSEAQYAIELHVERTLATLQDAGVERAVLFCQDWGGPIGLGCALAREGLLAGLVLCNTFWGIGSEFHHRVYPWRAIHAPVAGPLLFGRRDLFLQGLRLSGPPSIHQGPAWRAYNLPREVNGGAGATLAWPRAISVLPDDPTRALADRIWAALPSLDVPVRFVWGMADAVFPFAEQGEALRQRLPRGTQYEPVLIEKARHFVQEYAPAECSEACIAVAAEAFAA